MSSGSGSKRLNTNAGADRGSKGFGFQWLLLGVTVVVTFAVVLRLVSLHGFGTSSNSHFQFFKSASTAPKPTLTTTSAGVYGHVSKKGVLNLLNWHRTKFGARRQAFAAWLGNTGYTDPTFQQDVVNQLKSRTVDLSQPPPVYPACHIFVNHWYRFIYLRHAKAASTSLLGFFGICKDQMSSRNSTCLERLDVGQAQHLSLEELGQLWRDYFVFSFVRNPWSRAVSSYLMMMRSLERQPMQESEVQQLQEQGKLQKHGPQGKVEQFVVEAAREYSWDDFCADPASFHRICDEDSRCSTRTVKHTVAHIQAQFPCLSTAEGGWALDFIGRVEEVTEDLNTVLEILDERRGEGVPPLGRLEQLSNVNGRSCSEKDSLFFPQVPSYEVHCDREDYFKQAHPKCAQQLASYYQADVQNLRFEVPGESIQSDESS